MNTINSLVMIATGEYSDYCTTPYKVLKPFTFREAHALYLTDFDSSEFIGWLSRHGYIEDFPCHEMHVGSYGELSIEGDMADVLFQPEGAV